ncbi:helix-turn-helix transcriptional regulator [Filimonas effusa]|uniref:AraC family transcriptional regulator n=1 Tax=Filimonas effusa TaxID=2508721 RepID=A0A4Q1D4D6_9BACT|nr:helix-turn-helix transcriptional regulator [Filimonas effusa]RXK83322.1 AraC family transcriptional regulator [Filimonas effusa]
MNLLDKGQYLGTTFGDFISNDLSIIGSVHQKSESQFHQHKNAYLSILLQGIYIETSKANSIRVFPSEIIYRPAFYVHKNTFESANVKCLNIEFSDEWFRKLDMKPLSNMVSFNKINNFPFLFQLITDFVHYNHIDIAEDLLLDLTTKLISKPSICKRIPWIEQLIAIIDNETECVHSLKSLSERIHQHPNYMARAFKLKTGMSIGQYQIEQKLSKATKELLLTSSNIVTIGINNGFFDEAHFIKTFRSKYGITPHQFRRLVKS